MSERWIVNASPFILLAKVNHLDLLEQLSESFVVPEAVVAEILAGPPNDPARLFLEKESINTVTTPPHPLIVAWDLGAGETAVLSHALINPPYKVIVDDGAARRCAHTLSIPPGRHFIYHFGGPAKRIDSRCHPRTSSPTLTRFSHP